MSIPITIVGGYLGAGKTSLINHVLSGKHGRRVTVLVNDFGSINIDASLIADQADDTISLTNGCACCAIQDDLGSALQAQIERTPAPDHILIEMSGVAEPGRIRRYAEAWPGVHLDAVVTLADAETVRTRIDDKFVGRVARRQLEAADFVVLNKADLVSGTALSQLSVWLQDLCPQSRLIATANGVVDPRLLFEPALRNGHVITWDLGERADSVFRTAVVEVPGAISRDRLDERLEALPASIHRIKGFFTDSETGRRMLVQVVGRRTIYSEAPSAAGGSPDSLVVIGLAKQDVQSVRELVASLCNAENVTSP